MGWQPRIKKIPKTSGMKYLTYGEKVQEMIDQVNRLYEHAEGMRDLATGDEKEFWNTFRGVMYNAEDPLRKLRHGLGTKGRNMADALTYYKKGDAK